MRFAEVAATSGEVRGTTARTAKRDALASLLTGLDPSEVEAAVGFLTGEPRQGRIGVGWRTVAEARRAGARTGGPTGSGALTIAEVDHALTVLASTAGSGSRGRRHEVLAELFGRASPDEAELLAHLLTGELRQGALAGVMADAVAAAAGVPASAVRRAAMLSGRLDTTARLALTGGRAALDAVQMEPGRAIQPMLASTAESVAEAVDSLAPASVEWKLDGIRIQVHRVGEEVRVFSRNRNDLTERVPGVVDLVRSLPADRLVLDGEALASDGAGRPALFQDTMRSRDSSLRPFFFDLLHLDGRDLLDLPLAERRRALTLVVPHALVPADHVTDPEHGERVLHDALAAGHEGVVVKAMASPYEAGRRGRAWRKVKPVHTLDLVVLAAEWGSGRRVGWLSNLHLGARDPAGGFVMVGKTFKGLTDDLLRWQTDRFRALAQQEERVGGREETGVVWVRPELVVEIAVDGVQRSTRYPGGVALRFARVVRYRDDKDAADADTIGRVQAMLDPGSGGGATS
jgi:DNA ligase-1